jgi:hypothetical protein
MLEFVIIIGNEAKDKSGLARYHYEYCTISTNSSVTGHKALRREEFVDLSQVTLAAEEMGRNFRRLRR